MSLQNRSFLQLFQQTSHIWLKTPHSITPKKYNLLWVLFAQLRNKIHPNSMFFLIICPTEYLINYTFSLLSSARNPECSESVLCGSDRTQGFVPFYELPETRGGVACSGSTHVPPQIQVRDWPVGLHVPPSVPITPRLLTWLALHQVWLEW